MRLAYKGIGHDVIRKNAAQDLLSKLDTKLPSNWENKLLSYLVT